MLNPSGTKAKENRVAVSRQDLPTWPHRRLSAAAPPIRSNGNHEQRHHIERTDDRQQRSQAQQQLQTIFPLDHRPDHSRGVRECPEHQDHDQRRQIWPAAESADAGAQRIAPQFAARRSPECRRFRAGKRGRNRGRTCNPCFPLCGADRDSIRSRECPSPPRMHSFVAARRANRRLADFDLQRRNRATARN